MDAEARDEDAPLTFIFEADLDLEWAVGPTLEVIFTPEEPEDE